MGEKYMKRTQKIKMIGIGAAVLILLMTFLPTVSANQESQDYETPSSIEDPDDGNDGFIIIWIIKWMLTTWYYYSFGTPL